MQDNSLLLEGNNNFNLQLNIFSRRKAIHSLLERYCSDDRLFHCLADLQQQINNPRTRPWQSIDWDNINLSQIVGIDRDVFLSILVGAIDTEAPIRGYTQTSRQYLEKISPTVARFVGGVVDSNGNLSELGLWEKEERQHSPTLIKIYHKLTGEKPFLKLPKVRSYRSNDRPYDELYYHGLHRTFTEYGATCLYLYLAAHTRGTLQKILSEILQDEINHMVKFWGFGIWLYPDSHSQRLQSIIWEKIISRLCPHFPKESRPDSAPDVLNTFQYMTNILSWQDWSIGNKIEFIYILLITLERLRIWSKKVSPQYLNNLLGEANLNLQT